MLSVTSVMPDFTWNQMCRTFGVRWISPRIYILYLSLIILCQVQFFLNFIRQNFHRDLKGSTFFKEELGNILQMVHKERIPVHIKIIILYHKIVKPNYRIKLDWAVPLKNRLALAHWIGNIICLLAMNLVYLLRTSIMETF